MKTRVLYRKTRIWALGTVLGLLSLSIAVNTHIFPAYGLQTQFTLPQTTDPQTCAENINTALSEGSPLSSSEYSSLLSTAENSSQYKSFAEQAGMAPSLVPNGPNIESHNSNECSELTITAYTFSFASAKRELSVAVDPNNMTVIRSLNVPRASYGVALNQSSSGPGWGGGYSLYNGSSYTSPSPSTDSPWYYIEATFAAPGVGSPDSMNCNPGGTGCLYAIWAGLTNAYDGEYIAQAGFAGQAFYGYSSNLFLFTQYYTGSNLPNNCSFSVTPGDTILAVTYSEAYASVGGSTSSYYVEAYDSTSANSCTPNTDPYTFSDLGSNSYFAYLGGESLQSSIDSFSTTSIKGTIYDNVTGGTGGPSGHCVYTPYSNGDAIAFHINNGSAKATASDLGSSCTFADHFGL